jgi:pyridoxine kinase
VLLIFLEVRREISTMRVLSIQSHTVHGYVGNRCAVFPLQRLGFEVDAIHSVQFSNHTGYPSWRGEVLQGEQLSALVEGLQANSLLEGCTHLLTGYIGSASFLRAVLRTVHALRAANAEPGASLTFVCDPVLGDNGKLYVPEELIAIYRDEVVPLASVLTPNQVGACRACTPARAADGRLPAAAQFEAETLTERKIESEADAAAACKALHARGPHTVIITSMSYPGLEEHVLILASRRDASGAVRQWRLLLPRLPRHFTGARALEPRVACFRAEHQAATLSARRHGRPDGRAAAGVDAPAARAGADGDRPREGGRQRARGAERHAGGRPLRAVPGAGTPCYAMPCARQTPTCVLAASDFRPLLRRRRTA